MDTRRSGTQKTFAAHRHAQRTYTKQGFVTFDRMPIQHTGMPTSIALAGFVHRYANGIGTTSRHQVQSIYPSMYIYSSMYSYLCLIVCICAYVHARHRYPHVHDTWLSQRAERITNTSHSHGHDFEKYLNGTGSEPLVLTTSMVVMIIKYTSKCYVSSELHSMCYPNSPVLATQAPVGNC